ncbi:hypothetical protein DES36_1236 [Alkalibaculum bacchi]|jgi:hypothetical protein|uniref:Uncharacterized protein n=1 Tax=Alkalibaculum bacchi TaxID=645887 RepID=A0A366HZV6_9FIRM|nr:hypothetical protein [Alkalibaculum bacchi]RBP58437.1 hypothetical protein DES36_1236 [Alkalibaculum bacchi]
MTFFTDSVYEKMMVQKPIYGREKISPAPDDKKRKKKDRRVANVEHIPISKERNVKK